MIEPTLTSKRSGLLEATAPHLYIISLLKSQTQISLYKTNVTLCKPIRVTVRPKPAYMLPSSNAVLSRVVQLLEV